MATTHDMGANFVAVRRQVEQRLPTGTVRLGVEILLLAGIDYPQLTPAQKQHLGVILHQRLADLEQLIARIAWAHERQGLRVIREEFTAWVQADHLAELPLAPDWDRPRLEAPRGQSLPPAPPSPIAPRRERGHGRWRRVVMIASLSLFGVLMLGGVIGTWFQELQQHWRPTAPPSQQSPCSGLNVRTLECFIQTLQDLAAACQQQPSDFVLALHRALRPYTITVPDLAQQQRALYADGILQEAVLEQYYRRSKIKPYIFLKDQHVTAALRDLLREEAEASDLATILTVRNALQHLGRLLAALHTQLVEVEGNKLPQDEPFAKVIRYVQALPCAMCAQIEPTFPFLTKADEEVVGVFHALFLHAESPVRQALPAPTYAQLYGPESSLRSVLLALVAYAPQIHSAIEAARERAEKATQNHEHVIRGQRTLAYQGLRDFFDRLGAIPVMPSVSLTGSQ